MPPRGKPRQRSEEELLIKRARDLGMQARLLSESADRERRLPRRFVERLAEAGMFSLLVGSSLGGKSLDAVSACKVFEILAAEDGSTGWLTMVGNGGFFTGFLEEAAAEEILESSRGMPVGTAFTYPGRAIEVDGGYRVSGQWSYASGIDHSVWMVVTCDVVDKTKHFLEKRNFFVPSSDWVVTDTWHTTGLRATGSHTFVVDDAFVPLAHTYEFGSRPVLDAGLYQLPVRALMAAVEASIPLGIARGALTAFRELASSKTPSGSTSLLRDRAVVQIHVAEAEALIRAARSFLFDSLRSVAAPPPSSDLVEATAVLRLAATNASASAAQAVDLLHHDAGASTVHLTSRLGRAFCDVHAAAQHMMLSKNWYEPIGRVLLGVEPDAPL